VRFYLDDLRNAPPGWTLARTIDDGLALLAAHRGEWDAISLDHDLGDERDRTGCEVVRAMAGLDVWSPDLYVHSLNRDGRDAMLTFIAEEDRRHGLRADRVHRIDLPRDHTGCETTIECWYCAVEEESA
jgi:hypothetical protein